MHAPLSESASSRAQSTSKSIRKRAGNMHRQTYIGDLQLKVRVGNDCKHAASLQGVQTATLQALKWRWSQAATTHKEAEEATAIPTTSLLARGSAPSPWRSKSGPTFRMICVPSFKLPRLSTHAFPGSVFDSRFSAAQRSIHQHIKQPAEHAPWHAALPHVAFGPECHMSGLPSVKMTRSKCLSNVLGSSRSLTFWKQPPQAHMQAHLQEQVQLAIPRRLSC